MKLLIALACTCAVAVVVLSESCRRPDDCKFEICSSNASHIACHFGTCTCDANAQSGCKAATDCHSTIRCRDNRHHMHCVDGRCLCLPDRPGGK